MAGSIATAIRTWFAGRYEVGSWDKSTLLPVELGFRATDFMGVYFDYDNYEWQVQYDGIDLTYLITVTKPDEIGSPEKLTLDYTGAWK